MKKSKGEIFVSDSGRLAYLEYSQAAVVIGDNRQYISKPDADPVSKKASDKSSYKMVPWGSDNLLPQAIITKTNKSHDISSNMLFNIQMGYGQGIMPVKIKVSGTGTQEVKISYEPVMNNKEINEFFENNEISDYLLESLTDLNYFYNTFSEIIFDREPNAASRKIVELGHLEASFCRFTEMNTDGKIEKLLYSAKWDNDAKEADITAIDFLPQKRTLIELKRKLGILPQMDGKTRPDKNIYKYALSGNMPTPGRSYYQRPPWYSLIESGWYDFAVLIPEFKRAILNNQMTIKYMVYLADNYFEDIFKTENITSPDEKKARVAAEMENINNFLAGAANSGKAAIGRITYSTDGKEKKNVIIEPIQNHFKGGEYIEDSEEVSNIIAYAMGVHSSIIGSHGKAGTISGSEARELFIIKQGIMKPLRDRLLKPLNIVKAINKWPEDIFFVIPNLQLTTVDSGTGSIKSIS